MLKMLAREDRRLMTSRVTITRGTWPNLTTVAADVPALVRPTDMATRTVSQGGAELQVAGYMVRVDAAEDVLEGDVLTVTASRDEEMVGRWLTVDELVVDEWQTSRRLICMEARRG